MDGKIQARVKYDFRARDTFNRSATSFDYENTGTRYTSEGEYESESVGGSSTRSRESDGSTNSSRDYGSYYGKGKYKSTAEPAIQITSMEAVQQQASLDTTAALMGNVDISFKSETFPLEKLADSFQIGQIQSAAERKGRAKTSARAAPPATANPTTPAPAAPAT